MSPDPNSYESEYNNDEEYDSEESEYIDSGISRRK